MSNNIWIKLIILNKILLIFLTMFEIVDKNIFYVKSCLEWVSLSEKIMKVLIWNIKNLFE